MTGGARTSPGFTAPTNSFSRYSRTSQNATPSLLKHIPKPLLRQSRVGHPPTRNSDSIHQDIHHNPPPNHEPDYLDPASSYALPGDTQEIDPAEVSSLQSTALNPLDCNYPPRPTFAPPRAPGELVANLLGWRSLEYNSPVPFETFHQYHKQHRRFASQRSFRILADVAINEANFGSVRFLFREMERSGVTPAQWTHDTWAIWVRWMVRRGKWPDAWQTVQRSFPRSLVNDQGGLPLEVWLEFWAAAKRGATRRLVQDESSKKRWYTVVHFPYELNSDMGRYHILMENAPMLDQHRTQAVPPRVVYAIVRARLWGGKRDWAMEITRNFFKTAVETDDLEGKAKKMCLGLIHLHLAIGWKTLGFPALRAGESILKELLELNPTITPDPRTLALLLRMLGRTRLSGANAERLLKRFKGRYGDAVEQERVRLRVAMLALKEKNVKVLNRIITRQARTTGLKRRGCLEYWRWRRLTRACGHLVSSRHTN